MRGVLVKATVIAPLRFINVKPITPSGSLVSRERPIKRGHLSTKGCLIDLGLKDSRVAVSFEILTSVSVLVTVKRRREEDSQVNLYLPETQNLVGLGCEGIA